jgi:hypothetical protein
MIDVESQVPHHCSLEYQVPHHCAVCAALLCIVIAYHPLGERGVLKLYETVNGIINCCCGEV